jgi:hypothetical protein
MLRALDKKGEIILPAPQRLGRVPGDRKSVRHFDHDTTPVTKSLSEIMPLKVKVVTSGTLLKLYKSYIDQYHYLSFDRTIGENLKYMIYSCDNIPLACLLFGSAAWSCSPRDQFIGWNKEHRRYNLYLVTGNTRFLIFPWVKVPHLASHTLSLISHRICNDWMDKYAHPIYLLETFVEKSRFKGTSYKAANWTCVGSTTGRGRDGGHHNAILPIKDIYLYPLVKNFRRKLLSTSTS